MYKPTDADVIIIGGGLAGLTAAFCLNLKEPTLHSIVLEGSANVGGRALSVPLIVGSDRKTLSYFDVGGQWVCHEQNQLLNLLDSLKISTITQKKQGKIIVDYKNIHAVDSINDIFKFFGPYDMLQFTKFVDKVEILCKQINEGDMECIKELSQMTLECFIQDNISSKAVRTVIDYIVCLNCGTKSWQISALFYMFFCISTKGIISQLPAGEISLRELRIKGGVKNVCDKILGKVGRHNIFTDEYVTNVTCKPRYVEVKTKKKSYYCYDVIIAVCPKDILNINFDPPLPPNKTMDIRNTCSNVVTNFIVTYSTNFWTQAGLSGDIYVFDKSYTQGPIDFCANVTQANNPALAGRIFDGRVTRDQVYKNKVLKQLSQYFGPDALNPVDYFEKSCSLANSQMICWNVGNDSYLNNVATSNGRLFWAGAETSSEWYGYLAGAVHSGNRAALEVLYDLRPSLLTTEDMMILNPTRRSKRRRLKEYPKSNFYYSIIHWKYYVSVSVIVLLILWRCKKKYFK